MAAKLMSSVKFLSQRINQLPVWIVTKDIRPSDRHCNCKIISKEEQTEKSCFNVDIKKMANIFSESQNSKKLLRLIQGSRYLAIREKASFQIAL